MTKHLEQCVETVQRFLSTATPFIVVSGFYKNFKYIAEDTDMVIAYAIVFQQKAEENEKDADLYNELHDVIYDWAVENLKGSALKRFMKEAEHEE